MASRIEAGVTIEGSVRGDGELVVAGRIRGVLTLDGTLVVEEGGSVEAEVEAGSVVVGGLLSGSVVAHDELRVLHGGVVDARVRAARLAVADGAVFRGELQAAAPPTLSATVTPGGGRTRHAVDAGVAVATLTGGAPTSQRAAPRAEGSAPITVPPTGVTPVRKGSWFASPAGEAPSRGGAAKPAIGAPKALVERNGEPPRMPTLPRGRSTFGAR